MQNSNASNQSQSSEILSPTNNPMGAIKVEKQGSFTESASSPSVKKLVNPEIEENDQFLSGQKDCQYPILSNDFDFLNISPKTLAIF